MSAVPQARGGRSVLEGVRKPRGAIPARSGAMHEPRIDGARPSGHDEPFERREAHGRIDRRPPSTASDAPAPRWQVTRRSRRAVFKQLGGRDAPRTCEEAVESVPPQAPALAPLARQGVRRRRLWQVGMECGIEARYGRHVRQRTPDRLEGRATSVGGAARDRSGHVVVGERARRRRPGR